ncbi:S8 family peptidase [Mangrovivirga sp. M17]|uniref:S8 family peptidase n=1 Tax=Mangrovivirga halotolerans TaxID=2993936 RepID=A0ABT3RMJ3_9BACT|nr:S8 family peptidase [Mangrovivirga halotolerans]MCX2742728.1 S8 family peptidase [Mangrovivirga halotolerans]
MLSKQTTGTPCFLEASVTVKVILFLLLILISSYVYGQNNGTKDLIVRACKEDIGNGLISLNFSYENPNRQGLKIPDEKSKVKFENTNKEKSGISNFKFGKVNKAFSEVVNDKETVEWTVVNPNGNTHTVYASASSSHCPDEESGIIVPVYSDGKSGDVTTTELNALFEGNAGNIPSELVYQLNETKDKVIIEVIYNPGQLLNSLDILQNTFGLTYSTNPLQSDFIIDPDVIIAKNLPSIDVFFPINRLNELNLYGEQFNFARSAYPGQNNVGITTSQGDTTQRSNIVRESFRTVVNGEPAFIDGTGVKAAVMSNGFNTQPAASGKSRAQVDVENGDLPGPGNPNGYNIPVNVIFDYPYGPTSDEGRGMLQTFHDVAPGAELLFSTGTITQKSFEVNFQNLVDAGADMVCDDITFVNAPLFGITRIGKLMQEFSQIPGKVVYSSIGNFYDKAYQGTFKNSSTVPPFDFIPNGSDTRAHVFGTNPDGTEDIKMRFSVTKGVFLVTMHWSEPFSSEDVTTGANTDLDFYVVDDNNNLLVNINRFSSGEDAGEIAVFEALEAGEANIVITSANGPAPEGLAIRLVAYVANGLEFTEYAGASTVGGHQMTPEIAAVGASYYANTNPQAQTFSSHGGTLPNGQVVAADFLAPDGGNINVVDFSSDVDGDGFPNFFGTSAAAPHAAASHALLLQGTRDWFPDGLPNELSAASSTGESNSLLSLLKNTSTPASGDPLQVGAGFIDVEAAFKAIASQTAKITKLIIEDGKTPSAEPFIVTILGEYLPEDPIVNFDGQQLTIIETGDGYIKAIVPEFDGNPDLTVETQPTTPSGLDGGDSNVLRFFDGGKVALTIQAVNDTTKYGQQASFEYIASGLPEGQTYEDTGLPAIQFSTPAVFPYPDVNNYLLTAFTETELTPEQEELYQLNFKSGIFTVFKNGMKITPADTSFVYGQAVKLRKEFEFDPTGIADPADFLSLVSTDYQSTFYEENTLIIINKFRAIVNEVDILSYLQDASWTTSERTIQNKFRAIVNGMNVIDLDTDHFVDYDAALDDGTTNKFRAIVNKFRAIVNTADLLGNNVELSIENKFRAIVNDTGRGDETDKTEYGSTFTIVDAEDASTETEENGIRKLYSMDLITGLEVTHPDSLHYSFPGAFIGPVAANLQNEYGSGRLTITKADLFASIEDYMITQGEEINPDSIETQFSGYVYEDSTGSVFPSGIDYYFTDQNGNPYQSGATGIFDINITDPKNYAVKYLNDAKLYVNIDDANARKIRTYLDCVEYHPDDPDGLYYVANFRYLNPNDYTIYIVEGPDNYLSGTAERSGSVPEIFLSGEGTFKVKFDGSDLKWNLTSRETTLKTSTSSSASSSSNKCDSGEGFEAYNIYPNPVQTYLTIEKTFEDESTVEVFDYYGNFYTSSTIPSGIGASIEIDFSNYLNGMYIIRCTSKSGVQTFSIMKE